MGWLRWICVLKSRPGGCIPHGLTLDGDIHHKMDWFVFSGRGRGFRLKSCQVLTLAEGCLVYTGASRAMGLSGCEVSAHNGGFLFSSQT